MGHSRIMKQSPRGYEAIFFEKLGIHLKITNDNYSYYKIIFENLDNLIDYIIMNVYRNIKKLLQILKNIDVNTFIEFKCRYTYSVLNQIIKNNQLHLIDICMKIHNLPQLLCKNLLTINKLDIVYNKYGNHLHVGKFIETLGKNITKITPYNIDNIFMMFILTKIDKFIGFESWGLGNNKTQELNIINHHKKHVIDGNDKENWEPYLKNQDCKSYETFAIDKSKYMKNKIVHTNGTKVYLSGFYDKILIIGRLDNNNKLGISSCYIVYEDSFSKKLDIFNKEACFHII